VAPHLIAVFRFVVSMSYSQVEFKARSG
jgi:hypothetical protein